MSEKSEEKKAEWVEEQFLDANQPPEEEKKVSEPSPEATENGTSGEPPAPADGVHP